VGSPSERATLEHGCGDDHRARVWPTGADRLGCTHRFELIVVIGRGAATASRGRDAASAFQQERLDGLLDEATARRPRAGYGSHDRTCDRRPLEMGDTARRDALESRSMANATGSPSAVRPDRKAFAAATASVETFKLSKIRFLEQVRDIVGLTSPRPIGPLFVRR